MSMQYTIQTRILLRHDARYRNFYKRLFMTFRGWAFHCPMEVTIFFVSERCYHFTHSFIFCNRLISNPKVHKRIRLYVDSTCRFRPRIWEVNLTSPTLERVVWLSCLVWSTCAHYETHKMMIRKKWRFCVPRQYSKVDLEMLTRVSTLLSAVWLKVFSIPLVIHAKLLHE
jgi:hypothetical protein